MRFHDPEVDRIRDAIETARQRAKREVTVRELATLLDVPAEAVGHDLNHWSQLEEATEQAREHLAAAVEGQPSERSDRAVRHATDAILALIPRFTDPDSGEEGDG